MSLLLSIKAFSGQRSAFSFKPEYRRQNSEYSRKRSAVSLQLSAKGQPQRQNIKRKIKTYHEITKTGKHEKGPGFLDNSFFLRAFVLSCFRD
jgi:hypothetical protein